MLAFPKATSWIFYLDMFKPTNKRDFWPRHPIASSQPCVKDGNYSFLVYTLLSCGSNCFVPQLLSLLPPSSPRPFVWYSWSHSEVLCCYVLSVLSLVLEVFWQIASYFVTLRAPCTVVLHLNCALLVCRIYLFMYRLTGLGIRLSIGNCTVNIYDKINRISCKSRA